MNHLERIKKLQKHLSLWKVDGCAIENPIDLYYLTGLDLSAGILLVFPKSFRLFVDGRYLEMVRNSGSIPCGALEEIPLALKGKKKLAFDSLTTAYARYSKLKQWGCALKAVPGLVKGLRAIKSAAEIALLKKSGKLLYEGIRFVETLLKPGISEKEAARKFEIFCLEKGAERLAFDPIIAFGQNSAFPHHRAGSAILKKGDVVLVDAGVVIEHYRSDMTRMFFCGKEDPQLKKMYDTVRRAQSAALLLCRPGAMLEDLEFAANREVEEAGLEHLLAHGLGHGVGLEIHEFPRVNLKGEDRKVLLKEGMVITIEPGLYLPGKGGIRYEDTIIITDVGYEFAL